MSFCYVESLHYPPTTQYSTPRNFFFLFSFRVFLVEADMAVFEENSLD